MTNIRRYDPGNRPVFITAVTYLRKPFLREDGHKELLLAVMREVKASVGFKMHAYVILNDHFHWIITPGKGSFSKTMQSVKLRFVHRYKKAVKASSSTTIWQRRFWDHVIRDTDDLHRHMDYIHYNAVKHGYVVMPKDYAWSSFRTHVARSHYVLDWGAASVPEAVKEMALE